jgi:hypothetical protein
MKFDFKRIDYMVAITLNIRSYMLLIDSTGLKIADTGHPQGEVDYDRTNGQYCVKITGVDEV